MSRIYEAYLQLKSWSEIAARLIYLHEIIVEFASRLQELPRHAMVAFGRCSSPLLKRHLLDTRNVQVAQYIRDRAERLQPLHRLVATKGSGFWIKNGWGGGVP